MGLPICAMVSSLQSQRHTLAPLIEYAKCGVCNEVG